MDNSNLLALFELKAQIPEGYAVYFEELIMAGQQPMTSLSPLRMDILDEDNWFLEISFHNDQLISVNDDDQFNYYYFIAKQDNSSGLLDNYENLLYSGERSLNISSLTSFGLRRQENSLDISQPTDEQYNQNYRILISQRKLEIESKKKYVMKNVILIAIIISTVIYAIMLFNPTLVFLLAFLSDILEKTVVNNQQGNQKVKQEVKQKQQEQQQAAKEVIQQLFQSQETQQAFVPSKNIKSTIVPHLVELNPHSTQIDDNQIKFFAKYKATESLTDKNPEEVQQMEQISQQTIQEIEQSCENNDIEDNSNELAMAGMYKMYKNLGFNVQITKSQVQINEEDKVVQAYQSQLIQTGQTQNLKYLELKIQDSNKHSFDQIQKDAKQKKQFIQKFLEAASQEHNVPLDKIKIIDISKGSIKVKYHIQNIDQAELDQLVRKGNATFKKYFDSVTLDIRSFVENFQIRPDMFDPKYNMYWDSSHIDFKAYRGGFTLPSGKYRKQVYKFPVGYHGYGLNVSKLLLKDQAWLQANSNPTTWIVLFHGTAADNVNSIAHDGLKSGYRNLYGGSTCRLTNQKIKSGENQNTYFSDDVQECEGYAGKGVKIGSKNYIFVFQCRVNPQHVRSPIDCPSYYTVEEKYVQENVRPYRILVKKV